MILHARASVVPGRTWVVWLHGFLGSSEEWQPLAPEFSNFSQLWIDLPGHGASGHVAVRDFADVSACLQETLKRHNVTQYWLVGYSLGGRVAMYHACKTPAPGLLGLIVEGGNPGLTGEPLRVSRAQSDGTWALRFRTEPLEQVLDDWYRQPVFSHLTDEQRAALVQLRAYNDAQCLAAMLEATSLARQPDLLPALRALSVPFYYVCGERDAKFRALAEVWALPLRIIPAAGHNAHRENPTAFRNALREILTQADED